MAEVSEMIAAYTAALIAIVCAILLVGLLLAAPFIAIGWGVSAGMWLFCLPMAFC